MTSTAGLDLREIDELTASKLGVSDVACPYCGPERRSPTNRRRKVLRVWRFDPNFASFHCVRCGQHGHARDGSASHLDPDAIKRIRAETAERERVSLAERLSKARWLWSKRRRLAGSIGETYLREARGYSGTLPGTLGFLPARGDHGPAMIGAFGTTTEPEPGRIAIADEAVLGVHLTRLAPDGTGKAGTDADKVMLGSSLGSPVVLAPPNDLLGLAVVEGIEDGLSVFEATGLGVWAAGSASLLPALAEAVPDYVEAVTIFVDDDEAGQRGSHALAEALSRRGIEVFLTPPRRNYRRYAVQPDGTLRRVV
jgi:hypothetical protein